MNKKFLFVIEGGDGSGKATQTKAVEEIIAKHGFGIFHQEFPRYGNESAYFVEEYLAGKYPIVQAKTACLFYALDRYDAYTKEMLSAWREGKIIFCDRWVGSNKGHQVGKGKTKKDREEILHYINFIEHEVLGLPKATLTLYLDVHPLLAKQLATGTKNKKLTEKDLHESDTEHLINARNAYLEVAKEEGWVVVNCMQRDVDTYSEQELASKSIRELMRPKQEITTELVKHIQNTIEITNCP